MASSEMPFELTIRTFTDSIPENYVLSVKHFTLLCFHAKWSGFLFIENDILGQIVKF
ncbi:hypothetical protein KOR42_16170 [Thalassoglobus neptunius]|uniref:Uncharacterized protein n=1 Tax=Thalassoglobus neptunius TaxID=1938619 RepID=A0A5C5X5E7_9PLAN|nr:hypothetical protein KOR42_16170 [Thalassoglobus neptunius]